MAEKSAIQKVREASRPFAPHAEGTLKLRGATYHCDCIGASTTRVNGKDYIPEELLCARCGSRVKAKLDYR